LGRPHEHAYWHVEILRHHCRTAHQAVKLRGDPFKVAACGFKRDVAIDDVLRAPCIMCSRIHTASIIHAANGQCLQKGTYPQRQDKPQLYSSIQPVVNRRDQLRRCGSQILPPALSLRVILLPRQTVA